MVCSLKDHRFRSSPSTSKVEFQQPQPFFALLSPAPESAAAVAASVCMCDAGDFLGVDRSPPARPPPQVQCTCSVGRQVVYKVLMIF